MDTLTHFLTAYYSSYQPQTPDLVKLHWVAQLQTLLFVRHIHSYLLTAVSCMQWNLLLLRFETQWETVA